MGFGADARALRRTRDRPRAQRAAGAGAQRRRPARRGSSHGRRAQAGVPGPRRQSAVEHSYVVRSGGPERLTVADDDLPRAGRAVTPKRSTPRLYRRLFAGLAAIGAGAVGVEPSRLGPARGRCALLVPRHPPRPARARGETGQCRKPLGRSRRRQRPEALVCAGSHVDTVLDGGARSTARWASWPRSWRSRRCGATFPARGGRS